MKRITFCHLLMVNLSLLITTIKCETLFASIENMAAYDVATFAIIFLLLLVIIIGQCYAKFYQIADFSFFKLLSGLFYMWDFYSDVVWSWYLAEMWDMWPITEYVFYCSVFFILFPVLSNIFVLYNSKIIWCKRTEICPEHYNHYIGEYSLHLLYITILTGSAFAAIELANSCLFGLKICCMKLTHRYYCQFRSQRVLFVVLGENIPQLCLEIIVLTAIGINNISLCTIAAMLSSILSAFISIVDYVLKQQVLESRKQKNEMLFEITCQHKQFGHVSQKYTKSTSKFEKLLSETVSLHPNYVDVLNVRKGGGNDLIKVKFIITPFDKEPYQYYRDLITYINNGEFGRNFKYHFNIKSHESPHVSQLDWKNEAKIKQLNKDHPITKDNNPTISRQPKITEYNGAPSQHPTQHPSQPQPQPQPLPQSQVNIPVDSVPNAEENHLLLSHNDSQNSKCDAKQRDVIYDNQALIPEDTAVSKPFLNQLDDTTNANQANDCGYQDRQQN